MRIVVIGATGHIGTWLVPRLVASGHEVVALSRGAREPYQPSRAWEQVERVVVDRDAEDAAGTFAGRIVHLRPDAVVDLVCFTPESAEQLAQALSGRVGHLLTCSSIWVHGEAAVAPLREEEPLDPFGEYGTGKAAIERVLLAQSARGGVPTTVLRPGHISGPGWPVITPLGNLDPAVWRTLATGGELAVPGLGAETLHHVHADDVAQGFALALERRSAAVGEAFHLVAEQAMSVRGLARAAASWFGRSAQLRAVSWEEFRDQVGEHADASWEHLSRSHVASIAKAQRLLGYAPRWSAAQAVQDAVRWLVEHGEVDVAGARLG